MDFYIATVSSKEQILIPKHLRAHLGVGPGDTVQLDITKDRNLALTPSEQLTLRQQGTWVIPHGRRDHPG